MREREREGMGEKGGSEGGREGGGKTTVTQKGEGGRAWWNLNVLKPEQEQQQHHKRHHLLSAQSEGMECRGDGGGGGVGGILLD